MSRLFQPGQLGGVVFWALAVSVGIAWGSRRLRLAPLASWSLTMIALIWFIGVRFFPGTLWGPFPAWNTMLAIGKAIRVGGRLIAEEAAPVDPVAPLMMFIAAGVWMTVWLVHTSVVALRNPLLGIASVVPLFAFPGTLVTSERLWFEAGLVLVAGAIVVFVDQQRRLERWGPSGSERRSGWRTGPALRLGLAGVALSVAVAPLLPGFFAEPSFGAGRGASSTYFNPLVAIKPALRNMFPRTLFAVEATRQQYYRLTSLDVFDGREWRQLPDRNPQPFPDGAVPSVTGPTTETVQTITIAALAGPWLPAAYEPRSIAGAAASIEPAYQTLLIDGELSAGLTYEVVSVTPALSSDLLDGSIEYRQPGLERYLSLPSGVVQLLRPITEQIVDDARTPYQQALAIQSHLRGFRYDESIAAGHSFDSILEFLTEVKAGYCEQFAGTMAVLARIQGIPSRVAIGFGYGQDIDGNLYRITTREAHAWVELWFPQAGWVAFEPTPRGGVAVVPQHARPERNPADPNPPGQNDPTGAPTPTPSRGAPPEPDVGAEPRGESSEPRFSFVQLVLLFLAASLAVALIVVAVPRVRALVRLRRAHDPRGTAAAHYVDFLEWCAAAGLGRNRGETPREHAARLGRYVGDAKDAADRLASAVEAALWAPPNGADTGEIAALTASIRRVIGSTFTRRRRAITAAKRVVAGPVG